jgi:rSAM/selenodomain-associated transferase 2
LRKLTVALLIPALEEETSLRRLLPGLVGQADEVVVSDGGSTDATVAVSQAAGAQVVVGPRGRGGQLNRAAAASQADVFLFLHADTELPADGIERVREAIRGGAVGGGFELEFATDRALLRFGARLINRRSRLTKTPLGDQAQFVTRAAFAALGGYRDWPILEDLDFARRLKAHGPVALLDAKVVTSPRRFERLGVPRTIATNWLIWLLFALGLKPERLARLYR